jgi:hypothetical protein
MMDMKGIEGEPQTRPQAGEDMQQHAGIEAAGIADHKPAGGWKVSPQAGLDPAVQGGGRFPGTGGIAPVLGNHSFMSGHERRGQARPSLNLP